MGDFNFEKDIADTLALQKEFWDNEYPELSFEEKINYWLGSIHKGMRTQGETFGDELLGEAVELFEVVTGVEEVVAPVEA